MSVVKTASSPPEIPRAVSNCSFSESASIDAIKVVIGVTFSGKDVSLGTSEIKVRLSRAVPVAASTPPFAITLGETPALSVNISILKKPIESDAPDGSPASRVKFPFRSAKTAAPAIGPSTTRPSNASEIEMASTRSVESSPSETLKVT